MEKNLTLKITILLLLILIKAQTRCNANETLTPVGCMVCPANQIPSPARDRCICTGNRYIGWDGFTCLDCPGNLVVKPSGDGCQCPRGQLLQPSGVQCKVCPPGQTLNAARTKCVCPFPQVANGDLCQCPSPLTLKDGACVCSDPGMIYSFGSCNCKPPRQMKDGSCKCPAPFVQDGLTGCKCPSPKIFNGGQCICPSPFVPISGGQCGCPPPYQRVGDSCSGCGNRIVEGSQQCDSTYGCSSQCKCNPGFTVRGKSCVFSVVCGDGFVQGSENCDNGNGEGCSRNCQVDPGYTCTKKASGGKFTSECTKTCGNSILQAGEDCDNGNQVGCRSNCKEDAGYRCTGLIGSRSSCRTVCGDGIRSNNQQCDNGNRPGCTNCMIDSGYDCIGLVGSTSRCTRTAACGNGILEPGEKCDNGGRLGCLNNCVPDPGYECLGSNGGGVSCAKCGNSIVEKGEDCDNGGKTGCRFNCKVDTGYTCKGTPSNCVKVDISCGNGVIEIAEGCDDGNKQSGDGCNSNCVVESSTHRCTGVLGQKSKCTKKNTGGGGTPVQEPYCGNGKYEPTSPASVSVGGVFVGEQCDNGNQPGCRGCVQEKSWTCSNTMNRLSICSPIIEISPCGNGVYEPNKGEQCDDGNFIPGDGCNMFCRVQPTWTCPNGIKCVKTNTYIPNNCGNGKYEPSKGEECDDGNRAKGDGCNDKCKIESSWACGQFCSSPTNPKCLQRVVDKQSTCKKTFAFCGNNIIEGSQQCDDGYPTFSGDGCSAFCKIEKGWNCYGVKGGGTTKCFQI